MERKEGSVPSWADKARRKPSVGFEWLSPSQRRGAAGRSLSLTYLFIYLFIYLLSIQHATLKG